MPPPRARALLRAGADLHAARIPGACTPLSRARELAAAGDAPEGSTAWLLLRAAEPWSRATHAFFPDAVRERVAELLLVGAQLARGKGGVKRPMVMDVWVDFVLKHAAASS